MNIRKETLIGNVSQQKHFQIKNDNAIKFAISTNVLRGLSHQN